MDMSITGLRVFREAAERGTLTAAAEALGYTQSAVSRQIAALEHAAGATLLERRRDGVRLTAAGHVVLRRAVTVLTELDAVVRELRGQPDEGGTVRLGWFASAGAVLVPRALAALRRTHPAITVVGREGSTPALVRALRAGTLDLAVLAAAPPFRPFDTTSPPLRTSTLAERNLCVAVPPGHPLATAPSVSVEDLRGRQWVASPAAGEMGVWPGLDERPFVTHTARDWLAKLNLVAAGAGLTTVPAALATVVPPGVTVRQVDGEPRRLVLAWLAEPLTEPAARLGDALRTAAVD
ncbi:DNA-binding transcriptional LysR family regulator [Actinophytocola oryzae]|uniref:DNA-binding transcriptional LysR family regulator n=2 Tax=Actinophytocola oryzae TaxID=502181 RepID=A0A4V3FSK2_9PSEU|nr:DNA-binding transcriptional LysR family regulator [Actinophytocola oryzae]